MTYKEQLWYLINGLRDGSYNAEDFCSEFTRIFDLEIDYETLSEQEEIEFSELSDMTARFSDDLEMLSIPNVYFNENQIREKVNSIAKLPINPKPLVSKINR